MATTQGLYHISRAELPRLKNKITFLSTLEKLMDKIVYVCFVYDATFQLLSVHFYTSISPEPEPDKRERKDYIENWSERTYKIEKGSWRERTEN